MDLVVSRNVPTCNGKHKIIFFHDKAIISVKEFFKIVHHWEKNVENICGKECQNEFFCRSHRLLNIAHLFKKNIVERILLGAIEEIIEIQVIRNCTHDFCMNNWCFDIHKKRLKPVSAMKIAGQNLKLILCK